MNPFRYLLVITLLSSLTAAGQYTSRRGFFQVDQISGCNPLQVRVTVTPDLPDGVSCSVFAVDWLGDTTPTDISTGLSCQLSHTYNSTGTFLLRVFLGGIGSNNIDDIQITVIENIAPEFDISACSNDNVLVTVTDRNYDQYLFDFDSNGATDATRNTSPSVKASFSYLTSGQKQISIRGKNNNSADNCNAMTKDFIPTPSLNLAILNTLEVTSSDSILLTYTPTKFVQYQIDLATNNNSNYQQYATRTSQSGGTLTEIINNLNNDNNYYCFRVRTFDPCTNTNTDLNPPRICSIKLDLNFDFDVNRLTWSSENAAVQGYTISRNENPAFKNVSATSSGYNDSEIICATDYCYRIIANYNSSIAKSISIQRCGTSKTAKQPTAIQNIISIADEDSVELTWLHDNNFQISNYFINRKSGTSGFSIIATQPDTIFTDNGYNNLNPYAYRIDYQDVCKLYSTPGIIFNPIQLKGTINEDNSVNLIWNNYKGYKLGVSNYDLEKFDLDGNLIRKKTFFPPDSTWLDSFKDLSDQGITYRITAYPNQNDIFIPVSKSNPLYLERKARLVFPTAFTPHNQDNLNDGFSVKGYFIRSLKLQIFNRWGELMFSAESEPWDGISKTWETPKWDGTHEGIKMPESVYIWKATVVDLLGRSTTQIGSVALLNN